MLCRVMHSCKRNMLDVGEHFAALIDAIEYHNR